MILQGMSRVTCCRSAGTQMAGECLWNFMMSQPASSANFMKSIAVTKSLLWMMRART
jgi:hypothetical protein